MSDVFKIKDPVLLQDIFLLVDKNKNLFVEMSEFIGEIVFYLKEKFELKFALFFEVCMCLDEEHIMPREIL